MEHKADFGHVQRSKRGRTCCFAPGSEAEADAEKWGVVSQMLCLVPRLGSETEANRFGPKKKKKKDGKSIHSAFVNGTLCSPRP